MPWTLGSEIHAGTVRANAYFIDGNATSLQAQLNDLQTRVSTLESGGNGGGDAHYHITLTLVHTGFSGINAITVKENDSTGTELLTTTFSPRLEDASQSLGMIISTSTTLAISANANSGDSSYSVSGPSTITQSGFSGGYRVLEGFTDGNYTLTVTAVNDD